MIGERIAAVRERVSRAAARARRGDDSVTLVAVSKTQDALSVRAAFAAGVRAFGENRVQEAEGKAQALADLRGAGLEWHLVGHLQENKARKAAPLFDLIHSVDGLSLGGKLARVAAEGGRTARALVQVDLAGEETKFGVPEDHLFPVLEGLRELPGLRLEGLMLIPPFFDEPERTRPFFRRLRALRDQALERGLLARGDLSMGMSHDFEVAIEEGATLVRVGTAIFGERKTLPSVP
ncbi:MAG TPA: YggS family pyridoxal phosphate-dependent enzyme [Vicinamibacteria bacterium]